MMRCITALAGTAFLICAIVSAASAELQPQAKENPEAAAQAAKHRAEINQHLDGLSAEMAKALSHPGFRGLVRSHIAKSKKREHILELEGFLGQAKGNSAPSGLEKLKQATRETRGRLKASFSAVQTQRGEIEEAETSERLPADGLDLYFPVAEHREKWNGNEDLLVAFAPLGDESDVSEIVAYSVKDGRRVALDPEDIPERSVLVIAAEEHLSHEAPVVQESGERAPVRSGSPDLEGDGPPEPDITERSPASWSTGDWWFGLEYVRIFDDQEPWWQGWPEVYFLEGRVALQNERFCRPTVTPCDQLDRTDLWYKTWHPANGTCSDAGFEQFRGDRDKMVIGIWERDGGNPIYVLDQIYPDVTCTWGLWTSPGPLQYDDRIDLIWNFHRYVPSGGTYWQRASNVEVIWKKLPIPR